LNSSFISEDWTFKIRVASCWNDPHFALKFGEKRQRCKICGHLSIAANVLSPRSIPIGTAIWCPWRVWSMEMCTMRYEYPCEIMHPNALWSGGVAPRCQVSWRPRPHGAKRVRGHIHFCSLKNVKSVCKGKDGNNAYHLRHPTDSIFTPLLRNLLSKNALDAELHNPQKHFEVLIWVAFHVFTIRPPRTDRVVSRACSTRRSSFAATRNRSTLHPKN
jgi:hypothetical protein